MSNLEEHFTYAMELVTSIAMPMVLLNAIKLKVLETIAHAGPEARLSAQEIASRLSVSNQDAPVILDRMLRLLATHSIVTCTQLDVHEFKAVRVYGLAPVAKHFIPNDDGVSLCPMLELHQHKLTIDPWFELNNSVREGGTPFHKVHGMNGYEKLGSDAGFNAVFNKAMADTSTIMMKELLERYHGFDGLRCLVDVGGGLGATLALIISKYSTIKGINLDLPHVIEHAPFYPGIEHIGGDMFHNIPQGDAIFMKWVLHGWGDDQCTKLLKTCYKALPDNGKVIVVDKILDFLPDASSSAKAAIHLDAIMLTQTPSGKERTEDEFLALAKNAGFGGIRKMCSVSTFWVIEFYK